MQIQAEACEQLGLGSDLTQACKLISQVQASTKLDTSIKQAPSQALLLNQIY